MEQLGQGTQQHAPQAPQSLPSYQVAHVPGSRGDLGHHCANWCIGLMMYSSPHVSVAIIFAVSRL